MEIQENTFQKSVVSNVMDGKFGNLIFLASVEGMGKVTFANNLIFHLLPTENLPIVVFSFDRPTSDWKYQLLYNISKSTLPNSDERRQFLDNTWVKVNASPNPLPNKKLYIDGITSKNVQQLKQRCEEIGKFHDNKLGLIVIDYFELMQQSETLGSHVILATLKDLAKQMQCPILVLSTLTAQNIGQEYVRPTIPNIPYWHEIEGQADSILFLYYPDYYFNPFDDSDSDDNPTTYKDGIQPTELIIVKQPNQSPRTLNLDFDVSRATYL